MAPERSGTTFPQQPLNDLDAPERLECVCSRKPLLARAGRCNDVPFIWVRNVRARLDLVVVSGTIQIKCRECNRWWTFRIAERVDSSITN